MSERRPDDPRSPRDATPGGDDAVARAVALLREESPADGDEAAWQRAAALRLRQRFREAFHGHAADGEDSAVERISRP